MLQHTEVELNLKPSLIWLFFTLLGGGVAIIASLMLKIVWLRFCLPVIVIAYLFFLLRRFFWRSSSLSVYGLRYRGGCWWIKTKEDVWREACIKEPPLVSAFVTILLFSLPSSLCAVPVVIFSDSAESTDRRQLRVLLRFNKDNR